MRLDKLGGVIALFFLIIVGMAGCAQVLGCIQNYGSCGL